MVHIKRLASKNETLTGGINMSYEEEFERNQEECEKQQKEMLDDSASSYCSNCSTKIEPYANLCVICGTYAY